MTRRATPLVLLATAALVLLPATPAFAHTQATYCGHTSAGYYHQQHYQPERSYWHKGRHIHSVQLVHAFSSKPIYDSISCAS